VNCSVRPQASEQTDGALAVVVSLRLGLVGLGLRQLGLRLFERGRRSDSGDLEVDLGAGEFGLGQGERGFGLVAGGDAVAGVDLQQQVAFMDDCIVIDVELRDVAGDFRGEGNGVALGVGVLYFRGCASETSR
jgi:hypothetical protein